MVQCQATQFVLKRYCYLSGVGSMVSQLGWETLQERRAKSRLVLLYKTNNQLISVDSSLYLFPITVPTRQSHRTTFQHITTRTNYHKFSYYPMTIPLWNSPPTEIADATDLPQFKMGLAAYTIPADLM